MKFTDLRLIDQLTYLANKQNLVFKPTYNSHPGAAGFQIPLDDNITKHTNYHSSFSEGISINDAGRENPSTVTLYINTNNRDINYNTVISRFGVGSNLTLTGTAHEVIDRCLGLFSALSPYDPAFTKCLEKFKILQEGLVGVDELTEEQIDEINPNVDGGLTLSYFLSQLSSTMFNINQPYFGPYFKPASPPVEDNPYKFTTNPTITSTTYIFSSKEAPYPMIVLENGPKNNQSDLSKTLSLYAVYKEGNDIIYQNLFTYNMTKDDSSYRKFTKNILPLFEETLRNCDELKGHEGLIEFAINAVTKTLNSLPETAPLYDHYCECDDD